jgi:hypothetical protein
MSYATTPGQTPLTVRPPVGNALPPENSGDPHLNEAEMQPNVQAVAETQITPL